MVTQTTHFLDIKIQLSGLCKCSITVVYSPNTCVRTTVSQVTRLLVVSGRGRAKLWPQCNINNQQQNVLGIHVLIHETELHLVNTVSLKKGGGKGL